MSSRAVNQALVRVHVIAENEHRMEDTIATLSEDCVFEDVAMGRSYIGLDGARAYYEQWWNAFDIMVKGGKQHWSEGGNTMVAETRYTGLHVGEFCGISATGRAVNLRLAVVITFRNGKMAGERFYYDARSLAAQLGLTGPELLWFGVDKAA